MTAGMTEPTRTAITAPGAGLVSESARRRPASPLRPYVAEYSGYRMAGPPGQHRGLPSPFLTVILTLDCPLVMAAHPDPRQAPGAFDALVGGLHDRPAFITHPGYQAGIQLALRPLGARALLGLPAAGLARLDVDLADVVGTWAHRLRERLLAQGTWEARFAVLDAALFARIARAARAGLAGGAYAHDPAPELQRAWSELVRPGAGVTVGGLAAELGWSTRRLHDRFRAEVGVAPKEAARIARFDRARRMLFSRAVDGHPLQLAELAAACGYYDQAHLAREFRDLAGCAPSRLVAEELRFVQAAPLRPDAEWAS